MKKIVALFFSICCALCLTACKDFFEPLPEDFFDSLYDSSTAVEETSSEDVVDTSSDVVVDDSSEEVVEPTDSSSEEVVEPVEPENSSDEPIVEPEEPIDSSSEDPTIEPDNSSSEEITDSSNEPEPEQPEEPVEPEVEEIVSNPLSFTEGEHTVENVRIEATEENADAVYANGEGTVVTIESGYYDGGDNGSTTAVYARDGAKVVINGGTFKAGEGCAAIYAKNNAVVEINGGFFEVDGAYNGTYFVLNLGDNTNSTIVVKGGTFVNFNPAENASENPAVNFVAEGYTVVAETKENGDVWYTVVEVAEND